MCLLRSAHFNSCEVCNGRTEQCPRQSNSQCIVPNALDMVHPSGVMVIKVNATSEIGSTSSDDLKPDIYNTGNILRLELEGMEMNSIVFSLI